MKFPKVFRRLAALLTVTVVVSCAVDQSTAPPPPPNAELVGGLVETAARLVGTLLSCEPLPAASDSEWIGSDGGTLQMGPHTLTIPRGALSRRTLITATAPTDTVNSVRFSPEGLRFAKPATLTMSYRNCNLVAGLLTPKRIAYTTEGLRILYYVPTIDNVLARKVIGRLDHFSRYAVGW